MSVLNAWTEAENERRQFYSHLAQYVVWWLLNGRRYEGQKEVDVTDIMPSDFIAYMKNLKAKKPEPRGPQFTEEQRREIRAKQDAQMRKRHFQKLAKQQK